MPRRAAKKKRIDIHEKTVKMFGKERRAIITLTARLNNVWAHTTYTAPTHYHDEIIVTMNRRRHSLYFIGRETEARVR